MIMVLVSYFVIFSTSAQTVSEQISSVVEKYTADSLLNGSILIAKNDVILHQGSFGYKNIETKDFNTTFTLFPVASLTKQFTFTAILILEEHKKLTINDKISKYIEVPNSMQDVQILNLMNHTSGIQDYWQNNVENNKDSILYFLNKNDTLRFTPNLKQEYCNTGYFLLGLIIESVSGQSYADFLINNIFKPLGMKNTFVNQGVQIDRAIAYDEKWNKNDYLMTTADGGIISTVEDLYIWNKELIQNKLLSVGSRTKMFSPSKLINLLFLYNGG